jgi:3-hydroxyisobutyrate dehydrogenase-like beta-hydroxyacid dehydrogenase
MKVGVIGLGIMGSAMSANLAKKGFKVYGYDVLPKARAALTRAGGAALASPTDVFSKAKIVITSLPSAHALEEVCKAAEGRGAIVIETSTLPIEEKAKARATLKKKGITLLDCPLSGTGAQAKAGDLVVFASGERAAYNKARPAMKGFSRDQQYVGEFGNGSKMKFVANLMVAIHNVSAGEAFALGIKAGLSPKAIFQVQANSAGTSRMFQVRGPMMVRGRYDDVTMKNEIWQKDMKIIGAYARELGVATPTFNASAGVYKQAMARGFGKQDTGAVCAVLEALSGVRRQRRASR